MSDLPIIPFRFLELPQPLMNEIVSCVGRLVDLLRFSQTCRLMRRLAGDRLLSRLHEFWKDIAGITMEHLLDLASDEIATRYAFVLCFSQLRELNALLPFAHLQIGTTLDDRRKRPGFISAHKPLRNRPIGEKSCPVTSSFGPFLSAHPSLQIRSSDVIRKATRYDSLRRILIAAAGECSEPIFVHIPYWPCGTCTYVTRFNRPVYADVAVLVICADPKPASTISMGMRLGSIDLVNELGEMCMGQAGGTRLGSIDLVNELGEMCMGQAGARFGGLKKLVNAYCQERYRQLAKKKRTDEQASPSGSDKSRRLG
jgi:hypothetical protein